MSTAPAPSQGPLYTTIQTKLTTALSPSRLELIDESSHHSKHAAMRGVTQKETHFNVSVISESFAGLPLLKRHRLIYDLLKEELSKGGLHALRITAKTPSEVQSV